MNRLTRVRVVDLDVERRAVHGAAARNQHAAVVQRSDAAAGPGHTELATGLPRLRCRIVDADLRDERAVAVMPTRDDDAPVG